jgi:hypothetical protein
MMAKKVANKEMYQELISSLKTRISIYEKELDMTNFKKKVDILTNEVINRESGKTEIDYGPYIKRANTFLKELDKVYSPLYDVAYLTTYVESKLDTMDETNKNIRIDSARKLVSNLTSMVPSDNVDVNKVANRAYKVLYQSILHEAMIDRRDTICFALFMENDEIAKIIEKLVKEDAKDIPNIKSIIDNDIANYGRFNILSDTVIKSIGLRTMKDKNDAFNQRKRTATMELFDHYDKVYKEKEKLDNEKIERKLNLRNLRVNLAKARLVVLSCSLVPILIMAGTTILGAKTAVKYKTIAKTYNEETKEMVNEAVSYGPSNHELSIKKTDTWNVKANGKGYERFVSEYKYTGEKDINEVSVDELLNSIQYVNGYFEEVSELPHEDSNLRPGIIVTETIRNQDGFGSGLSESLGGALSGLCSGALINLMLKHLGLYNEKKKNKAKDDIKNDKYELNGIVEWRVVKERYENLKGKMVKLKEEHKVAIDRYKVAEYITPEAIEQAKTYTYKK